MTHYRTQAVLPPYNASPDALRRAKLTDEWLDATPERRAEIIAEWEALNEGRVTVMEAGR